MNSLLSTIRNCTNCMLCKNQRPLMQICNTAEIFWVGLSAVIVSDSSETPLSSNTNSGKLINSIEFFLPTVSFYKTNLVKCVPLEGGKIRYPSLPEMKSCHFHLKDEIDYFKPKVVFLLGKQVASFVLKGYGITDVSFNEDFNYTHYMIDGIKYIPIHHPSFILVYKRKRLSTYMEIIETIIRDNIETRKSQIVSIEQFQDNQLIETKVSSLT